MAAGRTPLFAALRQYGQTETADSEGTVKEEDYSTC